MKEPKNSILKQYVKLFDMDGVKINFDDDALEAIADITLERKTGARGLRSVFEKVLNELMFTVPSDHTIEEITITADTVKNGAIPKIIKNPDKEAKKITVNSLKKA